MVRYAKLEYDIEIPEDITVEVTNNSSIEIKGPLGKLQEILNIPEFIYKMWIML